MTGPDYIVIYDPDEPRIHGKWFDRQWDKYQNTLPPDGPGIAYSATGMIEVRDDGAVAEIFMRAKQTP